MFGALDFVFEFTLDFFVIFEAVACTGVLASCDDAEDGVTAGLALSLGMMEVVDVVKEGFEVDIVLRVVQAIL